MSSARPESQNVSRLRPPGDKIDDRKREVAVQTSAQALETLFHTIERECCQFSARIEPTNGESSPITEDRRAQTEIFPTKASSKRQNGE